MLPPWVGNDIAGKIGRGDALVDEMWADRSWFSDRLVGFSAE